MLTRAEALQRLLAGVTPVSEVETLPTAQCLGRVLAAEVVATLDVPPADNSAMDGYALRAADAGGEWPVSQRVPAGHWPGPLAPGTVARVFTGATLPPGADVVVMQEHCPTRTDEAGRVWVRVPAELRAGQHIRRRGEDIQAGAPLLPAGTRLNAAALGLAASVGLAGLSVRRRLRVALFSTGDELVMPGEPLPPGAIYNSNRFTLRALLEGLGAEVQDLGLVPDRLEATQAALQHAAAQADVIVTSGGVSVGEEDHVKPAVQALGRLDLWQVAIKPGKPFAHGAVRRADGTETVFVGLPGNPVSSFITFLVLARPLLLACMGARSAAPTRLRWPAGFAWPKADPKREEFLRVRLESDGRLGLHPNQGSGVLSSLAFSDALAVLAPGQTVQSGDTLDAWLLTELTC
ncbi:MAG: gephyrin-like molybdotransferase Glp [Inhella sp.]|jgi:molybdopterin molybdotransferase|uniref:molybdopterin molybdotransferase MoeA n=1 Tax=Inhella sp. TaxID=1921806 RepID=UPI0022C3F436|nr:gephyrin-like molybdotransferase Glp [Inhella sp.]MCZ8234146.1 molybdopterin molybdotransferase MoeA [Inhella sp.]